ncbi:MAG: FAD-dependent oxidoreductase [Planctomycetes bacterium]|nr:FAD-dependent oxidoreductase [Planctomycetota bacterium]
MPGSSVIVVGAGLAGLCCALELHRRGHAVTVLEASDAVGGRVRSDHLDGFTLDRGFQVYLTSYPEGQRVLDHEALRLGAFYPGALVRVEGAFHKVADPRRKPLDAARGFLSPVATMLDKARLPGFERSVRVGTLEQIWDRPERATIDQVTAAGFDPRTIDRFFRPFFGGVFFDTDLRTSSRMFEFVFRMFGEGRASLPAGGMQRIPEQVASRLPTGNVRTNALVKSLTPRSVTLESGESIKSDAVVVAADMDSARSLLPDAVPARGWRSTVTLWFAAENSPTAGEPILVLDAEGGEGPVNHLAVVSDAAPTYAPPGASLVSASAAKQDAVNADPQALESAARRQLSGWYGDAVHRWRLLRADRIRHALPDQTPPALTPARRPVTTPSGVFICGDHIDNASINGAMESGRRAAEAVDAAFTAAPNRPA